jgi:hypothetical protein
VLDQLETAVRVEGEAQNPVFRLANLNEAFSEIFTEDVSVSIPELTSLRSGRQPLVGLAARATSHAEAVDVDFQDLEVDVGSSGLANVRGVAKLESVRSGGRREVDERRVTFRFVERDGDWRIDMLRAEPKDYAEQ